MTDADWRAESRKHEARAKEHLATVRDLTQALEVSKAKECSWRSAYHSLRISLENRLDRIADTLEIDYADTPEDDQ